MYTECTENSLRSTHRLQRAIQTYAESTENNSLSTQSLHRTLQTYKESTQSLYRVYAEQYRVYTADAGSTEAAADINDTKIKSIKLK